MQLVGGLVGAVLGSFVGMPQLGFLVGSMIGGAVDRAMNPITQEGPRMGDLAVSSSAYGNSKPILYGTARLPAQIIWTSGIKETKIVKKKKGKGGQSIKTVTYQYSANIACGLCEGPVTGTIRIWMDGKLTYDREGQGVLSNNRFTLRTYLGDESQLPDGLISSYVSPNPAYRGLCYIVLEDFQLEPFGNRIPSITVEVTNAITQIDYRIPTNFSVSLPATTKPNGVKYDRIRQNIYVLSYYGNTPTVADRPNQYVTIYDIDGNLIKRKSIAEIFSDYHLLGEYVSSYYSDTGLEVIPGGDLVLLTKGSGKQNLHVLDADALTVKRSLFSLTNNNKSSNFTIGNQFSPYFNGFQVVFDTAGVAHQFVSIGHYPANSYTIVSLGKHVPEVVYGNPNYFNGTSEVGVPGFVAPPLGGLTGETLFIPGKIDIGFSDGFIFNFNGGVGFGANSTLYVKKVRLGANMVWDLQSEGDVGSPGWQALVHQDFLDALFPEYGITTFNAFLLSAVYDPSDETLIILASNNADPTYFIKYDYERNNIVWIKRYNYTTPFTRVVNNWSQSDVSMGTVGIPGPTGIVVNTSDGSLVYTANTGGSGKPNGGGIWDSKMFGGYGYLNDVTGKIDAYYFNRATSGVVTLKSIVDDLCRRGGLDPLTDIDTTALSSVNVKGYIVARPTNAKATLDQLSSAYFIKSVESDYKIKFYLKSAATVVDTIPQKWLASDKEEGDFWKETRRQELEMPKKITITHINNEDDYQQGAQFQQRITNPYPSSWGKSEVTMEIPIVLNPTEAKALVTNMLYSTWAERVSYQTILPWRYAILDPTDTVTVSMDNGDSFSTRITGTVLGANFYLETNLISQDATTFVTPTGLVGSASLGFIPQTIVELSVSRIIFLDIPLIRDSDLAVPGATKVYFASEPYRPNWPGGSLDISMDFGSTFNNVDDILDPIMSGAVSGTIPEPYDANIIDTTTEIVVYLREATDELDSITEEEFLYGTNAVLINKEIIYFKNAVLNLDGSYTLSYLLRGRRGTEWACSDHTQGEKCYFLENNPSKIVQKNFEWTTVGNTYSYRLTTFGMYASDSSAFSYAFGGMAERPYAPGYIKRTYSAPNVVITWARRNRYNGTIRNGTDIPLIEGTDDYDVYILSSPYDPITNDNKPPTSYVRLYTVAAETATYTAADMTTDGFGATTTTLYVVIFQNNADSVGFPGYATLEA